MMACHLIGYPDLFVSFMCNTVEEGDGNNASLGIHAISSTMFQDKLRQLMRKKMKKLDYTAGEYMQCNYLQASIPKEGPPTRS
ncbi:hypothetical protein PVAP13_8NG313384 [Panicum virgatum]|uniref:Uncharacterized protein n=1 Tax=Panicum virgatum TaxID=38727 RepID=A0A8T0PBP1_PANVG|nr:hypothetical protein PVAP13_8NG313384 [Panicum virgatum]